MISNLAPWWQIQIQGVETGDGDTETANFKIDHLFVVLLVMVIMIVMRIVMVGIVNRDRNE